MSSIIPSGKIGHYFCGISIFNCAVGGYCGESFQVAVHDLRADREHLVVQPKSLLSNMVAEYSCAEQ